LLLLLVLLLQSGKKQGMVAQHAPECLKIVTRRFLSQDETGAVCTFRGKGERERGVEGERKRDRSLLYPPFNVSTPRRTSATGSSADTICKRETAETKEVPALDQSHKLGWDVVHFFSFCFIFLAFADWCDAALSARWSGGGKGHAISSDQWCI